jgi:hypothetical protein
MKRIVGRRTAVSYLRFVVLNLMNDYVVQVRLWGGFKVLAYRFQGSKKVAVVGGRFVDQVLLDIRSSVGRRL